jgi:hypothetical protein
MNKLVIPLNKSTSPMITLPRAYYNLLWIRYLSLLDRWENKFNNHSSSDYIAKSLKEFSEEEIIEFMAYDLLAISILEDILGLTKQSQNELQIEMNPCTPY